VKGLISVWGMEMKATACCSGSWFPLGAAEWSPQDFTLFLISYSYDLSSHVREGAALDNTCEEVAVLLLDLLAPWNVFEILCPADKMSSRALPPCFTSYRFVDHKLITHTARK